jgi:hypothetical protein
MSNHEMVVNSPTVENLVAFTRRGPSGAEAPLSDMTPFGWDRVLYFEHLASREQAEQAAGHALELPDYSRFPFLVFLNGDELVRLEKALPPLNLAGDNGQEYNPETATIRVVTRDPGPYLVSRLVERTTEV